MARILEGVDDAPDFIDASTTGRRCSPCSDSSAE
jgi:hypothetical protein